MIVWDQPSPNVATTRLMRGLLELHVYALCDVFEGRIYGYSTSPHYIKAQQTMEEAKNLLIQEVMALLGSDLGAPMVEIV